MVFSFNKINLIAKVYYRTRGIEITALRPTNFQRDRAPRLMRIVFKYFTQIDQNFEVRKIRDCWRFGY